MIAIKDPSRQEVKITFDFDIERDITKDRNIVERHIVINTPNWKEVSECYKYLSDDDGKMDLITPGRLLFDLCCFECDVDVLNNNQLMLSICSQLAVKYIFPTTATLKKN